MTPSEATHTSAWAHGVATYAGDTVLDAWFPSPVLGDPDGSEAPDELSALAVDDDVRGVRRAVVTVEVKDLQDAPGDTLDVWLRLHLLSHRLVRPHSISLDGVFRLLTNVVWTSVGPCAVEGFEQTRLRLRAAGHRSGLRRRQVPADDRLRGARPASGSPTPTGCGSAPTWPRARR